MREAQYHSIPATARRHAIHLGGPGGYFVLPEGHYLLVAMPKQASRQYLVPLRLAHAKDVLEAAKEGSPEAFRKKYDVHPEAIVTLLEPTDEHTFIPHTVYAKPVDETRFEVPPEVPVEDEDADLE
jgi:hypothetical protein